jgi:biotin carboxylase
VRPKVAVLHSARSFSPLDLFQKVGDDVELLFVLDASAPVNEASTRLLRRLGTVVDIAGLSLDEAASLVGGHRPEGIVSFVDDHLVTAAALAARLGLPYHSPEVASILVDKRHQRAAFDEAGIPGPRFWMVPARATSEHLAELSRRITYPAVLKPAEGSGSRGIRLVTTRQDLLTLLPSGSTDTGFILEEYLDDTQAEEQWWASYFSIESVISAGRASHVAITGRFPLAEPFRETGNFIPGILPTHLQGPVLGMVDDAIEALGITDAVIHTEIKLTPEGPRLIEVNGRLGGRPPFVLHSVSSVNLFKAACQVAVGAPVSFEGLAECRETGFWLMLQPPVSARRVSAVDGLSAIAALREIDSVSLDRGPGDLVDWTQGTDSQVVTVRGRVADHRALADIVDLINKKVTIDYEE